MEYKLTHPAARLSHTYQQVLEIGVTLLLMMGAYPIFKDLLVYLLMKLYEMFIQHVPFF